MLKCDCNQTLLRCPGVARCRDETGLIRTTNTFLVVTEHLVIQQGRVCCVHTLEIQVAWQDMQQY